MNTDMNLTADTMRSAVHLADRAVVCDVETEGIRIAHSGALPVYDIQHMLDPREHSPEFIDMALESLAYGIARGLLEVVDQRSLFRVRILRQP